MKRTIRIVLAGGGSGGHAYPAIAVVEALCKEFNEAGVPYRFVRMGPRDGYETLFENCGVENAPIAAGKMRAYASVLNFLDAPKFAIGFLQALWKLFFFMPDVIFSKGGTGAFPVVAAGHFYRIPIVIHESDAVPGKTNRASGRYASKIFVSFPEAARYFDQSKTELSGNPVRAALASFRAEHGAAKESLGFKQSDPLVLVLGGSQGARRINLFLLENLGEVVKLAQVLHQAGVANLAETERLARAATIDAGFENRYKAAGFLDKDMPTALAAADLAVARAGSGTIFELAAFGVPAILIPLEESANGHQRANAYAYAEAGAAVVIEEENLLPRIFLDQLRSLLGSEGARAKMSAAAAKFAAPGAAETVANGILSLL